MNKYYNGQWLWLNSPNLIIIDGLLLVEQLLLTTEVNSSNPVIGKSYLPSIVINDENKESGTGPMFKNTFKNRITTLCRNKSL